MLPTDEVRVVPAEILLCGHHHHRHRERLRALGATIYDHTGWRIDPPA